MSFTEQQLRDELARHQAWLEPLPGFAGSGVGLDPSGGTSIVIYTNQMPAATVGSIRGRLQGWPVHFEEMGPVRAFPAGGA